MAGVPGRIVSMLGVFVGVAVVADSDKITIVVSLARDCIFWVGLGERNVPGCLQLVCRHLPGARRQSAGAGLSQLGVNTHHRVDVGRGVGVRVDVGDRK